MQSVFNAFSKDFLDTHTSTTEVLMQSSAAGSAIGAAFGLAQLTLAKTSRSLAIQNITRTSVLGALLGAAYYGTFCYVARTRGEMDATSAASGGFAAGLVYGIKSQKMVKIAGFSALGAVSSVLFVSLMRNDKLYQLAKIDTQENLNKSPASRLMTGDPFKARFEILAERGVYGATKTEE